MALNIKFDLHFFQDDSLSVRSASEGVGLPPGAQMSLLVVLIGPSLVPAVVDVLSRGSQTSRLACERNKRRSVSDNSISFCFHAVRCANPRGPSADALKRSILCYIRLYIYYLLSQIVSKVIIEGCMA